MNEPKTAADLLAGDPNFKNYFQEHPEQGTENTAQPEVVPSEVKVETSQLPVQQSLITKPNNTASIENPLAEFGVPPPVVQPIIDPSKKQIFRIGAIVIVVILVVLLLFAFFKLFSR